jgi:hypothetical protein
LRKGFAFPAHRTHFLLIRAACPDESGQAARRKFIGRLPQRKGAAFPWSLYIPDGPAPDQTLKDYNADHIYGFET